MYSVFIIALYKGYVPVVPRDFTGAVMKIGDDNYDEKWLRSSMVKIIKNIQFLPAVSA